MGGNEKVPVMPFWVSDFFGSSRVQRMSGTAQAYYAILLLHQWQLMLKSDLLPSDSVSICRLLKITPQQWRAVEDQVRPMFETREGGMANPRAEQVLQETLDAKRKASDHGRRGAIKRWK
jgi:uncharacterized protein YdaU (DUF1376 family)